MQFIGIFISRLNPDKQSTDPAEFPTCSKSRLPNFRTPVEESLLLMGIN